MNSRREREKINGPALLYTHIRRAGCPKSYWNDSSSAQHSRDMEMDATAGLFSMRFKEKTSFNSTSYAQMVFSPPHVILLFRFFSIPLLLFKSQPGRVGKKQNKKYPGEFSFFFVYFSRIAWLGGNESLGSCVCVLQVPPPLLLLLLSNLIISGCYFHQTQHASLFSTFFLNVCYHNCPGVCKLERERRKDKIKLTCRM